MEKIDGESRPNGSGTGPWVDGGQGDAAPTRERDPGAGDATQEIVAALRDIHRELKFIKVDVEDMRQQLRAIQIHIAD